mgnify:CR=1 FL=1
MSRLEEAKQGLEEALARLEEKAATLTPSSESTAKDQALAQSQADNQQLKAVAESLDKRLDAVIANLALQVEKQSAIDESKKDSAAESENKKLADEQSDDDLDEEDLDDDEFDDDFDEDEEDDESDEDEDEFVELEYIEDKNV